MPLTVTTWNVNSIRLRIDGVRQAVDAFAPDILCLQETKVSNDSFPVQEIEDLGFRHHLIHGQKAYHGVAIFSKQPFAATETRHWCGIDDCRHAIVRLEGGVELHNLYIPAGGDVPDRDENPKFAHKLDLLAELSDWLAADRSSEDPLILVGDLNVAPLETDVWSHKQLLKVVSHTPVEVAALDRLQRSADFVDAVRAKIPPSEKLYSWWSYRARDWSASDRGRRLDHVWVTPALEDKIGEVTVAREARGWDKPSDHVPVSVTFDL
ncbi:MAG: exodeoxyribonuclease III [Geminicoccaceae bacterium]